MRKGGRSRIGQVVLAFLIGLVVLTLLLLPLHRAEISLDATVRSMQFRTERTGVILPTIAAKWVIVQGHSRVHVPPIDGQTKVVSTVPVVRIESKAPDAKGGLLIDFPSIPPGARVELIAYPDDRSYELILCGVEEPTRLLANGPVRFFADSDRLLAAKHPMTILIVPQSTDAPRNGTMYHGVCGDQLPLRFRFVPASGRDIELPGNLVIRDLRLFSLMRGPDGTLQPRSSILSGTLRIRSIKADPRPLHRNEFLILEESHGEIRGLRMQPATINFDFEGSTGGISVGAPPGSVSLMPRLLEWWMSRNLILLAWSAGLSALGLVFGLYKWFRKPA